jgi:3-oxoacid CoA-transferase B subunit
MVKRAFAELKTGDVVNLGIGIPTLVADLIKPEDGIILHTENGKLGISPAPTDGGGAMDYPVNAGKIPVTALQGSSYFDSADSFAMIRGGHVDVAIMGGLEVDEKGNLANWGHFINRSKGICNPALESVNALTKRIKEAAQFMPLDNMCVSPQCGFSSTHHGNALNHRFDGYD